MNLGIGDWGLGIGDWGLGIGGWGGGVVAEPQRPVPERPDATPTHTS